MNLTMSLTMKIKQIILPLCTLLLIGGCANQPSHVIVSPVLLHKPQIQYVNKQAALEVTDLRTNSHIVQISKDGEAATLFSSQAQLSAIVKKSLVQAFNKQGLSIEGDSANKIHVYIEQAKTSVKQSFTKYSARNNIALRITIENSAQTFSKTFSSKGSSNGPFSPDIAVLERDLNQQLGNLLSQIVQSNEISSFIR